MQAAHPFVSLRGKAVILSGAASEIGRAVASTFMDAGAKILSVQANPESIARAVERASETHFEVLAVVSADQEEPRSIPSDLDLADLSLLIDKTTWPFFSALNAYKASAGYYPRYAVSLAREPRSDHAAALMAASVAQTLSRYAAWHLQGSDARVNVIEAASGATPEAAARLALSLCSGYLDAMSGQVLYVDREPAGGRNGIAQTAAPFAGQVALVTGGTRGIGLSSALLLAKLGAKVFITHRWGTEDNGAVAARFTAVEAAAPSIICADAGNDDDTASVMSEIAEQAGHLDIFVSNVAFAPPTKVIDLATARPLKQSLRYSAWPLLAYLRAAEKQFGRYPRQVIGMSSGGPDTYCPGYDCVAAAKSALEALGQYLDRALRDKGVHLNILRASFVETQSLLSVFGDDFPDFYRRYGGGAFLTPGEVGEAVAALASGLMDGVCGQVLTLDKSWSFSDNLGRLFESREKYNL